jgi:cell division septation protein DedD
MMTPLLIDNRSILKLASIFVFISIIVFAGGFFTGFQRATTMQQTASVTQSLSLPVQSPVMQSNIDAHPPEVLAAGEDIDVDQPEIKLPDSKNNIHITPVHMDKNEPSESTDAARNSTDRIEQISSVKVDELTVSGLPVTVPDVIHSDSASPELADTAIALASNELSKIKYSIQVGTFGRLNNAENMMRMLRAKQYAAYITDNTTRNGSVRYNVRYGYFTDKKSATHDLRKFKSDQGEGGDGYLVKFSADSIVNVAGSNTINEPVDLSTAEDQSTSSQKPAVIPAENVPGNISQAEVFHTDVFEKSITKTN